jgi:GTP-binding protein
MPWNGPIPKRTLGAMVADRTGASTPYAIFHLQERGVIFIGPGTQVYEGMVIGEASRPNDLNVNICREKKLTNIRAAGRDENVILTPPRDMTLERCLEWVRDDEMVEVTPQMIRVRKRVLASNKRDVRYEEA